MQSYSIKDLEVYTGIKAHTIRIWEKRYQLLDPDRTESNIRSYTDKDLRKLLNIATLRQTGMKISEISKLSAEELSEKVKLLIYEFSEDHNYHAQINALVAEMLNFDEKKFDQVFASCVLRLGFKDTLFKVIYPLLGRIGYMWTIGEIHPAHEHFVSHLVRQKISAATDGLIPQQATGKRFLLFLPSNEYHELALLMANYLLRANQHEVLYLGQSVPNISVVSSQKEWQADYILCANVSKKLNGKLPQWCLNLSKELPSQQILLAGNIKESDLKEKLPNNVQLINSFDQLMENFI